jgi:leucyl aminopeptidase
MKLLLLSITLLSLSANASIPPKKWVVVDPEVFSKLNSHNKNFNGLKTVNGFPMMQLNDQETEKLSGAIHDELHRCGGMISFDTELEAQTSVKNTLESVMATKFAADDYTIDQAGVVGPMVNQVEEEKIRSVISKLSSFNSRHYKSETGVQSSNWIKDTWSAIAKNRSDIKVELFKHNSWPQPSVILTLTGSEKSDEIVVIGGHADSINQSIFGGSGGKAPGADDNASGIATITEILRVLVQNDFKPKRTIQLMAYAAEEVGLLGSKEIANSYKTKNQKVVGVIQFDMTNVKSTPNLDIVMMTDYTNRAQNEFLGKLIDEYVKVSWGYSKCGYGCSDHASWTNAGYPASMPFESTMEDLNRNIHTTKDLLDVSGNNADHAEKFSKLGIAFLVEMAN